MHADNDYGLLNLSVGAYNHHYKNKSIKCCYVSTFYDVISSSVFLVEDENGVVLYNAKYRHWCSPLQPEVYALKLLLQYLLALEPGFSVELCVQNKGLIESIVEKKDCCKINPMSLLLSRVRQLHNVTFCLPEEDDGVEHEDSIESSKIDRNINKPEDSNEN